MFSREFKQEAVELVTKRGVNAAQASRDLGIHATVLRRWVLPRLMAPQLSPEMAS
jgi:transposase